MLSAYGSVNIAAMLTETGGIEKMIFVMPFAL